MSSSALSQMDDSRVRPTVAIAVECFVLNQAVRKIITAIKDESRQVERYQAKLDRCSNISAADLEIPEAFRCDLEAAAKTFKEFPRATTPIAKLHSVKHTLDAISACVNRFQRKHKQYENEVLTTDDMIPLLALVIIRSRVPDPHIHTQYTQDFGNAASSVSDLGFALVTLEAALRFIMSPTFGMTTDAVTRSLSENSIDESALPSSSPSSKPPWLDPMPAVKPYEPPSFQDDSEAPSEPEPPARSDSFTGPLPTAGFMSPKAKRDPLVFRPGQRVGGRQNPAPLVVGKKTQAEQPQAEPEEKLSFMQKLARGY